MGSLTGVRPLAGWPPGCLVVHLISGSPASESALAVHTPCMKLTPGTWPSLVISSSSSILRVTPEHVIHYTRMACGLGSTSRGPTLLFGSRCPISPHYLVASRYILMTDVWPLWLFGARVLQDTGLRCSWGHLRGTDITSGQSTPEGWSVHKPPSLEL